MVIVVCPLTAIIIDQVRSFTARGLAVAAVTSTTCQEVKERVTRGDYSLVYFTPERLLESNYWKKITFNPMLQKESESVCC